MLRFWPGPACVAGDAVRCRACLIARTGSLAVSGDQVNGGALRLDDDHDAPVKSVKPADVQALLSTSFGVLRVIARGVPDPALTAGVELESAEEREGDAKFSPWRPSPNGQIAERAGRWSW